MKSLLCKKSCVACALIAAVLFSCVSIGLPMSKTPDVTVSLTRADASAAIQEKSVLATAASQLTYSTVDSHIVVKGYTGTSSSLVIPASIDGKPVTEIAAQAFFRNKKITSVYLPESVMVIGTKAFGECDSLTAIEAAAGNTAFASKNGVLYNKTMTVLKVFPGGLEGDFTIPKTVTKIDSYAFYYCYQVTAIQMYNAVLEIGAGAFSYCWNMTSIRLSDNLKTLGASAVAYCESLRSIYLPKSITSIGSDALLGFRDSDGTRKYNLVDGIFCVPGSYAYGYVQSLGLTPKTALDTRYEPDADTSVAYSFADGVGINAAVLTNDETYNQAAALVTGAHYYGFKVYQIDAVKNGDSYTLPGDATVQFGVNAPFAYPYALKVYQLKDGELTPLTAQLTLTKGKYTLSVSSRTLGTFVVAEYFDLIRGDIDGDGKIQISDARLALRAAADLTALNADQTAAADINGNGSVDVSDARRILRHVALNESLD